MGSISIASQKARRDPQAQYQRISPPGLPARIADKLDIRLQRQPIVDRMSIAQFHICFGAIELGGYRIAQSRSLAEPRMRKCDSPFPAFIAEGNAADD